MKRWKKEFYEHNYMSDEIRRSTAIIEECGNPKSGLYEAAVVSVSPQEDWHKGSQVGTTWHSYKVGEKFLLRQHKYHFFFKEPLWFDVIHPGRDYCEDFWEICETD